MSEPGKRAGGLGSLGIRGRLNLSLLSIAILMLPVVVLSLWYTQRIATRLEGLTVEVAQTVETLEAAPRSQASGTRERLARVEEGLERSTELASRALRNTVTFLLLSVIVLGMLVFLLPRQLTGPLRRVLNAVRRAANGDYVGSVQVSLQDELGTIARELNRLLARIESERRDRKALLHQVRRDLDLLGRGVYEAICVVDEGLVITYANDAFEELVGAPGDLSARRLADWIPDETFLHLVRKAFKGGTLKEDVTFATGPDRTHTRQLWTTAALAPEGHVDRIALVLRGDATPATGPRAAP